jgi:hypothetical protein
MAEIRRTGLTGSEAGPHVERLAGDYDTSILPAADALDVAVRLALDIAADALDVAVRLALDIAADLARAGVPIFLARPAPPDNLQGREFLLPRKWECTEPDPSVVNLWRPGMALCAVMGVRCDGLDVDPRHRGDETEAGMRAAGIWPRSYGQATTPSGGTHDLIAPLGVGSRDGVRPRLDVKGGKPDGSGRGFLYIAPTVRLSKVTGELRPYVWTTPPDLDGIDA